jgi:hypothetical protein
LGTASAPHLDRLDQIASMASGALLCEVPRAAAFRAAIETWLEAADECDPAKIIEAIRASQVKRGRKPRRTPPRTRALAIQEGA